MPNVMGVLRSEIRRLARKEMKEKSLKARLDDQSARGALLEAGLRVFFLIIAIVVTSWIVWTIVSI